MALSVVHMVYLRVFRPILERRELAVALVAELCNFVTFSLGLALVVGPAEHDGYRCAPTQSLLHHLSQPQGDTLKSNLFPSPTPKSMFSTAQSQS